MIIYYRITYPPNDGIKSKYEKIIYTNNIIDYLINSKFYEYKINDIIIISTLLAQKRK